MSGYILQCLVATNDNFLVPSASMPGEYKFLDPAYRNVFLFTVRKYLNNFLYHNSVFPSVMHIQA